MIAFLRGRVLEKHPNRIIVDVQGVGYELARAAVDVLRRRRRRSRRALRVYTHVREDALQLFGFLTELERQLFERLIGISGIGPKLAIAVLSGLDSRELVTAVQRGDVARLVGIPGIGKKTAERIVLELRIGWRNCADAGGRRRRAVTPADRLRGDLISALQNLGYHRPQAEKAVEATLAAAPDATFEDALRRALRELMR